MLWCFIARKKTMERKQIKTILFFILAAAFFAGSLAYPVLFNRSIDFLNEKLNTNLPYFWNVPFMLGLDLQGGTHLVYEADVNDVPSEDRHASMQGLRDIIERRVNIFGVQEPIVQIQESGGHYRLVIELAGVKDPAEAIKMIGETPFLEFRTQRSEEEIERILNLQKETIEISGQEDIANPENLQILFEDPYFEPTILTGQYLKRADLSFDPTTYRPIVQLQFNAEGSEIFKQITTENVGKQVAIYIDNVLLSAPVVQEPIPGGQAQITGDFNMEWARDLVKNLNAGALPVPINLISQQTIGPTLGAISLEQSLIAGIYGFLAIIIFMIIFYRASGILASFALLIYLAFFMSLIKLVPVTLTLAGIGGVILSLGMAVDANVLIFSRTREELKGGKNLSEAIITGFQRSWLSIRDGNITTLLVAFVLFFFGTSFIKGFALTLSIGILLSMFSAIFLTKNLMLFFAGTKLGKWQKIWL